MRRELVGVSVMLLFCLMLLAWVFYVQEEYISLGVILVIMTVIGCTIAIYTIIKERHRMNYHLEELNNIDQKKQEKFKPQNFLYCCLILFFLVYLIDTIINITLKKESSTFTGEIIETIKNLLFTVSGYIFGKKINTKESNVDDNDNKDTP